MIGVDFRAFLDHIRLAPDVFVGIDDLTVGRRADHAVFELLEEMVEPVLRHFRRIGVAAQFGAGGLDIRHQFGDLLFTGIFQENRLL